MALAPSLASAATTSADRVLIFDTTLRDGEQSPGCSMTQSEKLRVAKALAELGVDIIEAGFPIASPGDWESVNLVAGEVHGPIVAGLAGCSREDIETAWRALKSLAKKVRTMNAPWHTGPFRVGVWLVTNSLPPTCASRAVDARSLICSG
jgi:hypothetical protein